MPSDGCFITLAWPDTMVRKVGMWYDYPLTWLGICNANYYKAGHAACLLVNYATGDVNYYDFGRYHTPEHQGRVRGCNTDPELEINTKAISNQLGEIENIDEILTEVAHNKHTHGSGKLWASLKLNIDYTSISSKINSLQNRQLIDYGPLDTSGTNCSRFVAQAVRPGLNGITNRFLSFLPYTLSPTPKSNIRLYNSYGYFYELYRGDIIQKHVWTGQTLNQSTINTYEFD